LVFLLESVLVRLSFFFLLIAGAAFAQTTPIYCTPGFLYAGKSVDVRVTSGVPLPAALTGRWNGAVRPTTRNGADYLVSLTADDLAQTGFGEISLADASGKSVGAKVLPIGYNVLVRDIVFDRGRNRAYLSTPPTTGDPRFPADAVMVFDPATGAVGPVLSAGSGPGNLALSDDGTALYIAYDNDGVVRRVDPDRFSVVSQFQFRPSQNAISATFTAGWAGAAVAVMPAKPGTVAVYCHPNIGISTTNVSIFDNGVKRPADTSSDEDDGILFSPDGAYLFLGSFRNFNSPQAVSRFQVDASGIPKQAPGSAAGGGPVMFHDGLLYTSRGTIVDYRTLDVVGVLSVGGAVAVDPPNQRVLAVYFAASANASDYPEYLQAFDLATQQPLGYQSMDSINYFNAGGSSTQRLIRFGEDGLIFTSNLGLMVFHTPLAAPAPKTTAAAVVNAASQASGPIAPGEILTIYGKNLGPAAPVSAALNAAGRFDSTLAGVQVWFDRAPGTVLLGYDGQVNAIAPFALAAGSTVNLQVWRFGIPSARIPLPVASAAPALFTRDGSGKGLVAIINQDGSVNAPSPPGSVVTLFGTGGGAVAGAVDGGVARGAQSLGGAARLTIDGVDAPILYAGSAPFLPNGVFQVNAQTPAGLAPGAHTLTLIVNGVESPQGVTFESR
jgi:uncharacterized protein (TIGR03437 family)